MHWYFRVLSKYACFEGRASRREFWTFHIYDSIILILAIMADQYYGLAFKGIDIGMATLIYGLIRLIPIYAVIVRRLHDTGKSGWYYFIHLIPFAGPVLLLIAYLTPGNTGPNQYGPDPLTENEFQ